MEEHPHVTVFRQAHESLQRGDMEAAAGLLADDVVWHQIGGATLRGKEAVMASMEALEEADFTIDIHDVVGNDQHVVGLIEADVGMGDRRLRYRTAEIAHMRDGQITERWAFSDDTQRIADFFGPMPD